MCLVGCYLVLGKVNARDIVIGPKHTVISICYSDIITCYYCNSFNNILLEYFGERQVGNVLYVSPEENINPLVIDLGEGKKLEISSPKWFQIKVKIFDSKLMVAIEYKSQDIRNIPLVVCNIED